MAKLTKVEASSMVEVMVATIIFVFLLFLSLTVLLRLSTSGLTIKKLKYDMLAVQHADSIKMTRRFLDESIELDEVKLIQKVSPQSKRLLLLEIDIIAGNGDTLVKYKELIYDPN